MSASLLSARDLGKDHGAGAGLVHAVDAVDLDILGGECIAIVGPSGCGKSSLLYLLGGLERPTRGTIRLGEDRIDSLPEGKLARLRRGTIGFVFQAFELVDELSAVENVELPALLGRTSPRVARRQALERLDQVGLGERADHLPSELSGGQRQRVAIARAIANDPTIVFADEPTGNLDSAATADVLRLFDELRQTGLTLVIVTHDSRIAATADRLITMRDGSLVDDTNLSDGTGRSLGEITGLGAQT